MRVIIGHDIVTNASGFPFLFGGTFIEGLRFLRCSSRQIVFPFLFGGTFIEGCRSRGLQLRRNHFPSFSEGLSLRAQRHGLPAGHLQFPFLFGGTFIEGRYAWVGGVHDRGISLPFRRDFH